MQNSMYGTDRRNMGFFHGVYMQQMEDNGEGILNQKEIGKNHNHENAKLPICRVLE